MNTKFQERLAQAILSEHQFSQVQRQNQKRAKVAATKKALKGKGGRKVGLDWPRHDKDSFHSLQDPWNDQYNNRKGTADE